MAETMYVVRLASGRESEPVPTMTEAIILGMQTGLPLEQWTVDTVAAEPLEVTRQDGPGLPLTTVTVGGRSLAFLGSPGPLLPAAVRRLELELARMAPVDPRD